MTKFEVFSTEVDLIEVKAGEVIFKEGDAGDFMYAVIEGQVELTVRDLFLNTVKELEIFGEMAIINQKPRSATATAKSDCKITKIDQERFLRMVVLTPMFAIQVMEVLSDRLRRLTHFTK
ncbi:cyclic nucleotide-binding domain-containing protein [Chloroflexota bacterium]